MNGKLAAERTFTTLSKMCRFKARIRIFPYTHICFYPKHYWRKLGLRRRRDLVKDKKNARVIKIYIFKDSYLINKKAKIFSLANIEKVHKLFYMYRKQEADGLYQ